LIENIFFYYISVLANENILNIHLMHR